MGWVQSVGAVSSLGTGGTTRGVLVRAHVEGPGQSSLRRSSQASTLSPAGSPTTAGSNWPILRSTTFRYWSKREQQFDGLSSPSTVKQASALSRGYDPSLALLLPSEHRVDGTGYGVALLGQQLHIAQFRHLPLRELVIHQCDLGIERCPEPHHAPVSAAA